MKHLKFSAHLTLRNYPKWSAVQKITINTSRFCFFFSFLYHFYGNNYLQNCDKFSCRKIVLNSGFLSPKFIYISNLSSFLQLLALKKAYYLKIKIGLIIASRQNLLNFAAILELLRIFKFRSQFGGNPTLGDKNRQIPAIFKMENGGPGNRGTGNGGIGEQGNPRGVSLEKISYTFAKISNINLIEKSKNLIKIPKISKQF